MNFSELRMIFYKILEFKRNTRHSFHTWSQLNALFMIRIFNFRKLSKRFVSSVHFRIFKHFPKINSSHEKLRNCFWIRENIADAFVEIKIFKLNWQTKTISPNIFVKNTNIFTIHWKLTKKNKRIKRKMNPSTKMKHFKCSTAANWMTLFI